MAYDDEDTNLPPRVNTALKYLAHTRWVTQQDDPSIPARTLSPLERSVEDAALRALQAYLLGEMDYGDAPPRPRADTRDDEGDAPVRQPQPA